MATDLNESLRTAAAKPSREAPLTAIETRLRRRRRLRQGAVGLGVLALVGALGGGIALTSGDGPSVRAGLPPAAAQVTGGDPPISVQLPDGWVESPIEPALRAEHEVLTVGTALQPIDTPHDVCLADPSFQDDVFVQLKEFTAVVLLEQALPAGAVAPEPVAPYQPRPDDFSTAAAVSGECIFPGTDPANRIRFQEFQFQDGGRMLDAIVGMGPNATAEQRAEAYAVLNSLEVSPISVTPEPVVTTVPNTVPESADTAAIAAAFETWIASKPPAFDGVDGVIEDWASIKETAQLAAELVQNPQCYTGHVDAITRIGEDDADVIFSFFCDGQPATPSHQQGRAVKIDGVWMVSRDTVCETFAIGEARCPPRK